MEDGADFEETSGRLVFFHTMKRRKVAEGNHGRGELKRTGKRRLKSSEWGHQGWVGRREKLLNEWLASWRLSAQPAGSLRTFQTYPANSIKVSLTRCTKKCCKEGGHCMRLGFGGGLLYLLEA